MDTVNDGINQAIKAASAELLAADFNLYIGVGDPKRRAEVFDRLTVLVLSKMELESKDLLTPDLVGVPNPDYDDEGIGWDNTYVPAEEAGNEF